MKRIYIYLAVLIALLHTSCVKDATTIVADNSVSLPINISASYPSVGTQTRADDNGFIADDAVGIFIVDYNSDNTPGELKMNDVRAANALFEYNGNSWIAPYQIYWANSSTPADFYGYYPYDSALRTPTAYNFSVEALQNSEQGDTTAGAGYEQSDLLWAKAERVYPTTSTIHLQYKHLMAGITVALEMGTGFTADEWSNLKKSVIIGKTKLSGTVNLQDGSVDVGGENVATITPLPYKNVWRAVVMPQSVAAAEPLLIIDVDGQSYTFVKDTQMTYYGGKMHNFTIVVNKRSDGGNYEFKVLSDDIVAWIEDPEFHEGIVREYVIVDIQQPGTLSAELTNRGYDYNEIDALKITGVINHDDLRFIGDNLRYMTALNLGEVTITGNDDEKDCIGWIGGKEERGVLNHVILPANLKKIADRAFYNLNLLSIDIPDCVEYIGWGAFMSNNLMGEIKLPSSLKFLGGESFVFNTGLSGQLYLPEGLEVIEWEPHRGVFGDNQFTGPLILPSSLISYGHLGFHGTTGTAVLPPKVTYVPEYLFEGSGCTRVEFHNGIIEIRAQAFCESSLSGELVLPPNLKYIGSNAFWRSKISSIIFPESLRVIDDEGVFSECKYLTGVLELPKNVARIPIRCFDGCDNITGLIIPENCELIEKKAFNGCSSIGSIVCKATEPPLVCEDAFFGVSKDNFTVEVPKGCVEAYRRAHGWSDFKRIAEYTDFVCRPCAVNAINTLHSETIILNADRDWQVEHCPSWVTVSKTSGSGKTELLLIFSQMEHGSGNRADSIVFASTDGEYKAYCDVAQYDYQYEEDSCLTLQSHTEGDGIDIVFMGDGFDGKAISEGKYLDLVKEQIEYFFGVEPYKSHRDYFDVYVTFPLSQECGVNTMNTYVNNRFGTLYGYDGTMCTSNMLITSVDDVVDYAIEYSPLTKDKLSESLIILVPNDDAYDGNTIYAGNATLSICPPSSRPYPQDTRGVIQHEAGGHGFGKLADEQILQTQWIPPTAKNAITNGYHIKGWYRNIAVTSKFKDVPWVDFIFDTRYSDFVDIYEGAFGYMRGVFRSEANSCMNYGIPYYNAISRYEIMRRIYSYSGNYLSMEQFYANDSFEWGDVDGTTRTGTATVALTGTPYCSSNTHISPEFVSGAKMGDFVRSVRAKLKSKKEQN